jgi:hypothetical protein
VIVPDYRIYLLDKQNDISDVERVTYPTDHGAVDRALELIDDQHSAEIWAIRLVAKLGFTKSATV